jgi:hypothetical protein
MEAANYGKGYMSTQYGNAAPINAGANWNRSQAVMSETPSKIESNMAGAGQKKATAAKIDQKTQMMGQMIQKMNGGAPPAGAGMLPPVPNQAPDQGAQDLPQGLTQPYTPQYIQPGQVPGQPGVGGPAQAGAPAAKTQSFTSPYQLLNKVAQTKGWGADALKTRSNAWNRISKEANDPKATPETRTSAREQMNALAKNWGLYDASK